MMRLKTIAICLSLIGMGAAGAILAAPQAGPNRTPTPPSRPSRPEPKTARSTALTKNSAATKVQPDLRPLENYVVEPPDLLLVEALEALPGRPISGERLVRPDGKISLGFYGELDVAGLTIPEVKEKVVLHLRKYLNDDILGLVGIDPETGESKRDENGRVIVCDPKDTDRVFVDVTVYNSKNYYVQGAVRSPGRLPITGHETVLDAINHVGGLSPRADRDNVILYRQGKDGGLQRLPINIDQITMGDDPTTNYQLQPGDRLVIPARPGAAPDEDSLEVRPPLGTSRLAQNEADQRAGRPAPVVRDPIRDVGAPVREGGAEDRAALRDMERRLGEVERKLEQILDALERRGP